MKIKGYIKRETEKAVLATAGIPRSGKAVPAIWFPKSQITITPDIVNETTQDGVILEVPEWLLAKKEEEHPNVFFVQNVF